MADRDEHMPGLVPERDGYIPGVPCAVDTSQPDPKAAVDSYAGLFGWELEDVMPPESEARYFVAQLRGRDVAAVGSIPEGAPQTTMWRTYIWVDSADETASKVRDAGGRVVMEPFDVADDHPDTPAHWSVTFAVEDADGAAAKAAERGGKVIVPPFDAPWVRMTVSGDPQGATFTASTFVPENKDLGTRTGAARMSTRKERP